MQRLLNPTNDWLFKRLFGSEEQKQLTIHLLNTLLERTQPPVVDISFINPVLSQETESLRPSIVDVLCKAEDGRQFIVEMQRAADTFFIQRLVSYTCRAYINQRLKEDKEAGDQGGYDKVRPVICLAVMEKALFPPEVGFLSHHEFREIVTNGPYIKEMSFTFLELPKFKKTFDDLTTDVDRWAFFFDNAADVTPEQLKGVLKENSVFSQAYQGLVEASYTPDELQDYVRYDLREAEIKSVNFESRQEGLAEGLAKGRAEGLAEGEAKGLAEGKRQVAWNLLKAGLSSDQIAAATGLTEEELRTLQPS